MNIFNMEKNHQTNRFKKVKIIVFKLNIHLKMGKTSSIEKHLEMPKMPFMGGGDYTTIHCFSKPPGIPGRA